MTKYLHSPEGEALRALRHQADLTQSRLSQAAGYGPGLVGLIESGMWRPNAKAIRRLCAALGAPLAVEERILALRQLPFQASTLADSAGVTITIAEPHEQAA